MSMDRTIFENVLIELREKSDFHVRVAERIALAMRLLELVEADRGVTLFGTATCDLLLQVAKQEGSTK